MKNPIVLLGRSISELRTKSSAEQGFTPLSKVKGAVVMLSCSDKEFAGAVSQINSFFSAKGIKVNIYAFSSDKTVSTRPLPNVTYVTPNAVKWYGKVKEYKNSENLFIDLTLGEFYAVRNSAIRSNASFKIGRKQLVKDLYAVEITASENYSAKEVFNTIAGILSSVR